MSTFQTERSWTKCKNTTAPVNFEGHLPCCATPPMLEHTHSFLLTIKIASGYKQERTAFTHTNEQWTVVIGANSICDSINIDPLDWGKKRPQTPKQIGSAITAYINDDGQTEQEQRCVEKCGIMTSLRGNRYTGNRALSCLSRNRLLNTAPVSQLMAHQGHPSCLFSFITSSLKSTSRTLRIYISNLWLTKHNNPGDKSPFIYFNNGDCIH